tara:strand:- start:84566 stop:85219 length:654 start_codon:yes stop_codon:yes gene_type:complete
MKKAIIIFLGLFFSANLSLSAQSDFKTYMQESIALYDSVKTLADYQNIANRFDRIAKAEKEEWLPNYYAGLTYVYMSFVRGLEDDKRDEYLDQALVYAEKAGEIAGNDVEITVLTGYIYMAKVSVSPALRGMTMSSKVSGYFEKALAMSPNNPRANLMLGRWKYGTAQFFGSDVSEPCALMQKSLSLFEASKGESTIMPSWGQGQAEAMSKNCTGNN